MFISTGLSDQGPCQVGIEGKWGSSKQNVDTVLTGKCKENRSATRKLLAEPGFSMNKNADLGALVMEGRR